MMTNKKFITRNNKNKSLIFIILVFIILLTTCVNAVEIDSDVINSFNDNTSSLVKVLVFLNETSLTWNSSLDGMLGSGRVFWDSDINGSLENNTEFTYFMLGVGNHTINFTVNDTTGQMAGNVQEVGL